MTIDNKKFKIGLLGATFSTGNMGVNALTAGAIQSIIHEEPEAQIFLLDYGHYPTVFSLQLLHRTLSIPLLNMRFSKNPFQKNHVARLIIYALLLKIFQLSTIGKRLIAKNIYIKAVSEADILASMAAGDSFSDIYGLFRLFYITLPMILVVLLNKKLVLLPQTIGPFKTWIGKLVARFILKKAVLIYSRDYVGLESVKSIIRKFDVADKLRFCYDVGFIVDPIMPNRIDVGDLLRNHQQERQLIGVNISGLLYMGGYTRANMFGLKIDYPELINEILNFLLTDPKTYILLIPHVFGTDQNSENDVVVIDQIFLKYQNSFPQRLFKVSGNYNQNEIKYIIGLCDFFIGSRMHACIAALSQNIPAVAIAYSQKFIGVLETLSLKNLVADPRSMEKSQILNLIHEVFSQRESIKQQLREQNPKVKSQVLNLFHEIRLFL